VHADIRFTGGATRLVEIPLPKTCIELRATDASLVREIDALLDMYTDAEIADLLNERGGAAPPPCSHSHASPWSAYPPPTASRAVARVSSRLVSDA
jgi:hypothetical protein